MESLFEEEYVIDDIKSVASRLRKHCAFGEIIGFSGELGSGKTTLIRELVRQYGSTLPVSSPTYVLQHIYPVEKKEIHHWDLYRLHAAPEELYEGKDSGALLLVEWPENDERLVQQLDGRITLRVLDEATRHISLQMSRR